ncbi:MAG TPA: type I-F CRISPR-associated endoribonuclease Cas6/Csy4 [Dialister sp.]|nr:type I-F CRISPR-associated endoribonuclease Cas6/Csy4 [Dialister sp.]
MSWQSLFVAVCLEQAERNNMNYYQDITLIPNGEVSLSFLWTKVFTQLHLALAEEQRREGMVKTALAFPAYQDKELGNKIRILAPSAEQLERLHLDQGLERLSDYVHLTTDPKNKWNAASSAIAFTADISRMNLWKEKRAATSGGTKASLMRTLSVCLAGEKRHTICHSSR